MSCGNIWSSNIKGHCGESERALLRSCESFGVYRPGCCGMPSHLRGAAVLISFLLVKGAQARGRHWNLKRFESQLVCRHFPFDKISTLRQQIRTETGKLFRGPTFDKGYPAVSAEKRHTDTGRMLESFIYTWGQLNVQALVKCQRTLYSKK